MRLFKPKTILGWLACAISLLWEFLGYWARTEFLFRKVWPEESIMSKLAAIICSPLFPPILMVIGLLWIWWTTRLDPKIKQKIFQIKELINDLNKIAEHKWPGYNWQNIGFARTQLFEWKDKAKRLLSTLFGQAELDNFTDKFKYVENNNEYLKSNIGGIEAFYNEANVYLKYLSDLLDSIEKYPQLY